MNPIHARVLIVGKSASGRQSLRELLTELSVFQIDEAGDGISALTLHLNSPYELIVAEWELPQLSGIELARAVRNGSTRHTTPFALMSGDKIGARTVEALQAGANGLLELPLHAQRARAKLRRIIGALPERTVRGAARAADLWSPTDASAPG